MLRPVFVPLLNPNEREVFFASIEVVNGQAVQVGQLLATLETTKSTSEMFADGNGFVVGLRIRPGENALAGEIFCYLADTATESAPSESASLVQPSGKAGTDSGLPSDLRITQPALALARQLGIDLAKLPTGKLVTEKVIREMAAGVSSQFDPSLLVIYGAGGHGKTLLELVRAQGLFNVVGFIDDKLPQGAMVLGAPVLGGESALGGLYQSGIRLAINAVGGIGNLEARLKIFELLAGEGFACPTVVHPRAFIEPSAKLAAGVQVFALAYVGSESRVGYGTIINTGAIVSHDCLIGNYVNLSPGAILAGAVQVGDQSLVGMGATINLEVKIGANCRIGNGATIKADVPSGTVVRAGTIWPKS